MTTTITVDAHAGWDVQVEQISTHYKTGERYVLSEIVPANTERSFSVYEFHQLHITELRRDPDTEWTATSPRRSIAPRLLSPCRRGAAKKGKGSGNGTGMVGPKSHGGKPLSGPSYPMQMQGEYGLREVWRLWREARLSPTGLR